jgi:hypothetical protein
VVDSHLGAHIPHSEGSKLGKLTLINHRYKELTGFGDGSSSAYLE